MPKKEINLLPRDEFEKKPLGKLLIWALSVGRWIVVFTELIVILAFLSRFKLDRDLVDLYESIKAKQTIIASYSPFENDFRLLQSRLLLAGKIESGNFSTVNLISTVSQFTPVDVALSKIALSEGIVTVSGVALSEAGLKTFLKGLSQSSILTDISLANINKQKEGEGGIQFSLTAKLKNPGGKNGS